MLYTGRFTHILFIGFGLVLPGISAAGTSVNTSVNSVVSSSANDDVVVGDDVEINGPIIRGGNHVRRSINTDVDDDSVIVGNDGVDVGNGAVRVGNGVEINNRTHSHVKKKYKKRRYSTSQTVGNGVSKEIYQNGDCTVERKQVGSMSKVTTNCP